MFKSEFKWHFAKPEPYKHYFYVFYNQIKALPKEQGLRIEKLEKDIKTAINLFENIEKFVLLDDNSNGSHLPTWINVINAYKKEL